MEGRIENSFLASYRIGHEYLFLSFCRGRLFRRLHRRTADQVFAKPILYEKCEKNGTPCLRYEDFGDIRRCLENTSSSNTSVIKP
jgi:hypothetical protein